MGYGLYLFILSPQGEPTRAQILPILDAQLEAASQIASARFSPLDNSATMTCQRRGALQPRATPRGRVRVHVAPCKGAAINPETQGVALGWSAVALSTPESELCKSKCTSRDGWPLVRWLLFCWARLVCGGPGGSSLSGRVSGRLFRLRCGSRCAIGSAGRRNAHFLAQRAFNLIAHVGMFLQE
jgi:hypothetical protein